MSKVTLHLGKLQKEVRYNGWSWGAFFFGILWYLGHGMGSHALKYFAISFFLCWTIVVPLALPFVMAARFNREQYETLIEKGYEEVE